MSSKNRNEKMEEDLEDPIPIENTTIESGNEENVAGLSLEPESSDPLISTAEVDTKTNSKKLIKGKRRRLNPDGWKRNIRKQLRQAGKEYVNTSGQVTAKRRVKTACGPTCYLKCAERLSEDQRQTIHNNFWQLTDEQKNYFYWKFTSRCEPKRRRTFSAIPKRSYTFHYRFEVRGELMSVCGKFFYATLDITSIRIYYFYEHWYRGDICMPRELRSCKPEEDLTNLAQRLDVIREHIASFPSERLSANTKKRYLAADLNLDRMYKMYAKNVPDPLKQNWYSRAFNEEFNLEFRLPSKKSVQKERIKNETENSKSDSDSADNNVTDTQIVETHSTTTTELPVQLAQQLPAPLQWDESNISLPIPNMEKEHTNQGAADTLNCEVEVTNVPMLVQVPATVISTPFTTPTCIHLVEPQPIISMPVQLAQCQLQPTMPLQLNGNNIALSLQNQYLNYGWNHQGY